MTRLKWAIREVDRRSLDGEGTLLAVSRHVGVVPREDFTDRQSRSESLEGYKKVLAGDLVVNTMRAFNGALGVSPRDGLVSPAYSVLKVDADFEARYLAYLLRSDWGLGEIAKRIRGIGQADQGNVRTPTLAVADLGQIAVNPPVREQQRAIADYLDRETARIDALIERKHRLLDLLHERLEAAISDLVKGAWPAVALRRAWRVIDCKHVTPSYVDTGIPVVSPGDISTGRLRLESCARFVTKKDFAVLAEGDRRPRRGDIVYARNATVGVATYVDFDEQFCLGQDVCLIRSSENDQRFLAAFLNTVGARQLAEQVVGSTFSRINIADILSLRIPLPTREVQGRIADEIDGQSDDHWKIRRHLENQLSLMNERRQALITAAVTGLIPIPDAA